MHLIFVEKRCPTGHERIWHPFESSAEFPMDSWNLKARQGHIYVEARIAGAEVARVWLDHDPYLKEHYVGDLLPTGRTSEIHAIEVAQHHRRKGIATEVVRHLMEIHPDRRLIALSEEADAFWSSLGWDRYTHPEDEGFGHWRPLFIQPEWQDRS